MRVLVRRFGSVSLGYTYVIDQNDSRPSRRKCRVSFPSGGILPPSPASPATRFLKGSTNCSGTDSTFAGEPSITVMKDGHHVSRISDFIIYSVEAEYISAVVKEYGPCESDQGEVSHGVVGN